MDSYESMFSYGEEPTLEAVLLQREKRRSYIKHLLLENDKKSLLCLKCNIPGPIKNNDHIYSLFLGGLLSLKKTLKKAEMQILFEREINPSTGPECFLVLDASANIVKRLAVDFESAKNGRLFDADVYFLDEEMLKSISRTELGEPERSCFLCEKAAKECSGRRIHSVEDLQKEIINIIQREERMEKKLEETN